MKEMDLLGQETGVRLDDMRPLDDGRAYNGFAVPMPPLCREALMLSADLIASTYAMDVQEWMQAGWMDATAQVERELYVLGSAPSAGRRASVVSGLRHWLTQNKVVHANPIADMADVLRQIRRDSDTGKALVMAHRVGNERYIIAICFMGTTAHMQDWISNLRMDVEDGMHRGFLQLTRQFESNESRIRFPGVARRLGLKNLTLADVIEEARRPDSRFTLWVTGHSQGGAVTQLYVHHKLTESGVLPQHILGYGFASPSVAIRGAVDDPASCPVYLVENSDDVVPRSGAQIHLGQRLIYRSDASLRASCYIWPRDIASIRCRRVVRPFVEQMRDMPSILVMVDAFLSELIARPGVEVLDVETWIPWLRAPMMGLAPAADVSVDAMLGFLRMHVENGYRAVTGSEMEREAVRMHQANIHQAMEVIGVKAFALALVQMIGQPHASSKRGNGRFGVYPFIAMAGPDKLVRVTWRDGEIVRSDNLGEMLIVRHAEHAERVRGNTWANKTKKRGGTGL